jgi:hypothetical protein
MQASRRDRLIGGEKKLLLTAFGLVWKEASTLDFACMYTLPKAGLAET